jgi:spermidine/putrescine transport system substrate-binding protein
MTSTPNLPPELLALATATRRGVPRRTFLRGVGAGGVAVAGAGLLSACGTEGTGTGGSAQPSTEDKSDTDKTLNFSNWQLYIDVDENDTNKRPSLDAFTAQTGVAVTYTEDITDNETFYAKISPQLRAGQDTGRDLFALTDWMADRLIRQNFVQKLAKENMPNYPANLAAALKSPEWDPSREYSAPWQSGLTGIAYNAKLVPEVRTIEELLSRSDLKGRITCLTEMRDTIGLIMLDQGKDPADFTDDDYSAAIDRLQQAVDAGQVRQFTGNEYSDGLAKGDLAACIAWSGDVIQLQLENPDIKFVAPEAGLMLWSDNMLIPVLAQHKKNAEKLIDYYYDPAVAAQLAAYVNYICPVDGAQAEMEKLDPELASNQLIFPSDETLAQTHLFKGLDEETETKYTEQFNAVTGA